MKTKIHNVVVVIMVIVMLSVTHLAFGQYYINPYPTELLSLVNVQVKDTSFSMIHKQEKGKFLLFVINNSSVMRCLPRYEEQFIIKSNCNVRQFGYHPRSYSVYCLPARSFIVLTFSKTLNNCKLFSIYEDEDFNEFLSWASEEDIKEAMVVNNLEPAKKKFNRKKKLKHNPSDNAIIKTQDVINNDSDSHSHASSQVVSEDDNVTNNEVISEVPSLDLEGLDSSSMDSLESVKLALKTHDKGLTIKNDITDAVISKEQLNANNEYKDSSETNKSQLVLNQEISLDSLDRDKLKDIIRELQSELSNKQPTEINVLSDYIIPKLYAVDSIPVNNDIDLLYKIDIGKTKFMNHAGEIKINSGFKKTKDFNEGMIAVKRGKWGFLNNSGEMVIKPIYMKCESFSEGLALVKIKINEKKKWGYIDYTGNLKIFPEYDSGRSFSEGFAAVNKDDFWGYINRRGIVTVAFKYDEVRDFKGGLAAIQTGGLWGYINYLGQYIINPRFDEVGDFSEGIARVLLEWNVGYIDEKGRVIIEPVFQEAKDFNEGFALVKDPEGKMWGFINTKGKLHIPYEFDQAASFSEGLAAVLINNYWGYINSKGALVIPAVYDEAGPFKENLAFVTYQGNWAYIDKNGKVIWKESDDDY